MLLPSTIKITYLYQSTKADKSNGRNWTKWNSWSLVCCAVVGPHSQRQFISSSIHQICELIERNDLLCSFLRQHNHFSPSRREKRWVELLACRRALARWCGVALLSFIAQQKSTKSISLICFLSLLSFKKSTSLLRIALFDLNLLIGLFSLLGGAIGGATAHNPPTKRSHQQIHQTIRRNSSSIQPINSTSFLSKKKRVDWCWMAGLFPWAPKQRKDNWLIPPILKERKSNQFIFFFAGA